MGWFTNWFQPDWFDHWFGPEVGPEGEGSGGGDTSCCTPASLSVGANGGGVLTFGGCCGVDCGGDGSGSGSYFETIVAECLDDFFGEFGGTDCDGLNPCAGNVIAQHWCLTVDGPANVDTGCQRFFDFPIQLDSPFGGECGWYWDHSQQAIADGELPDDWCVDPAVATSATVIMGFCGNGDMLPTGGVDQIAAPGCGVYIHIVLGPGFGSNSVAVYFIDIASFNCVGSNTFDLIGNWDYGTVVDDWPAQITITPCAADDV